MTTTELVREAIRADLAYASALTRAGLDRWDSFFRDYTPEVRAAYFAKIAADDARRISMLGGR